jgi:hypothetical protein
VVSGDWTVDVEAGDDPIVGMGRFAAVAEYRSSGDLAEVLRVPSGFQGEMSCYLCQRWCLNSRTLALMASKVCGRCQVWRFEGERA